MTFSFVLNNFSSAKSIQLWSESPSIVIENDLLEKVSYDSDWNTNNTDRTFLGIDMTGKNRETYIRWSMELEPKPILAAQNYRLFCGKSTELSYGLVNYESF